MRWWWWWLAVGANSLLAVLVGLWLYARKCQRFWRDEGVASTSPNALLGDMGDNLLGRKQISFSVDDIYTAFPDEPFVGFYAFHRPQLLIRDPKIIESVMVKDFSHFTDRIPSKRVADSGGRFSKSLFIMGGKRWKELRSKLITTFTANKMKLMAPLMESCASILDSLISEKCEEEEEMVDVKELISRFATDVVGCCIFGLQFNTLTEPESEYRRIGKLIFSPTLKTVLVAAVRDLFPRLASALKLSDTSPQVEHFFDNLLEESEDFRRSESIRRNDLMQLILDIRDRDRELILAEKNPETTVVDNDVVVANMMIFYAAGFETTASTLSFCLQELALHPEIQAKVRDEVAMVADEHEGVFTYDALKKLKYTEMVISETLRKYPAVGILFRSCTSPYRLPQSSCVLAHSTAVIIPVYSLHHDEKYYPNAQKFDPERFTPENVASRPPYTYLPFGDGPRICLAVRFAKMEMKVCLARIISKYEFSPCAKTEIPIKLHPRAFITTAKNGIYLQVRSLTKS